MARGTVAFACVLAVSLVSSEPLVASDPWTQLWRPLNLPKLAPEAPCPVSDVGRAPFAQYGVGKGVGPGSADPIRLTQPGSILTFIAPPHPGSVFAGSEWGGQKVLWFVAPSYRGHVLIRGGRLDGTDPLAFDGGREPPTELTIPRRGLGRLPAGLRARRPALPSVVHPSPQARLLRVPDRRDKLQSDDRFPCRALARPVDRPRGGVGRSPAGRMRTWHASSWG